MYFARSVQAFYDAWNEGANLSHASEDTGWKQFGEIWGPAFPQRAPPHPAYNAPGFW